MTQQTKWTKAKIEKFTKELRSDGVVTDANAFDMALSILDSEPGLKESIKKEYKVTDVLGWLANHII